MAKKVQAVPKSFEEAQRELEAIVAEIEGGQIGLEESLVKYERGTFLIQYCQGVLKKAEQQIELLSKSAEGQLDVTPMEPSPE
jgi:exodeoxyribonuclease VII small subunit